MEAHPDARPPRRPSGPPAPPRPTSRRLRTWRPGSARSCGSMPRTGPPRPASAVGRWAAPARWRSMTATDEAHRGVDLGVGGRPAQAQSQRPASLVRGQTHRRQHVGWLGGPGGAGGTGRAAQPFEVQGVDQRCAVEVVDQDREQAGQSVVGMSGQLAPPRCRGHRPPGGRAAPGPHRPSWPRSASASCHAAAMPTAPATFSVPARRCRSWLPPWTWGRMAVPRRSHITPMPRGPSSLWPATDIRSTPSALGVDGHPGRAPGPHPRG